MDANGRHESAYPRPATAWWGVALFTFGAILSYTDRQILAILVDPIRASLHLTDTQLSLLQGAAFAVLYSFLGLLGIPVGILGTGEALASDCCWIFLSAAMGTLALATILDLLPQESRGFGTSTVAFNSIIVGMGLGPTLVALMTDRVFHDSQAVGYS